MPTTNLRKVGGSIMLTLPPAVLKALDLQEGSSLDITIKEDYLVIKPKTLPQYNLNDLLAQCMESEESTTEDKNWLDEKPLGKELI